MREEILHKLEERIRELTALHSTARILQDITRPVAEVIRDVVLLLPPAWQFPEITTARICFEQLEARSPHFRETPWRQSSTFMTLEGRRGQIDVYYLQERPLQDEGPFLKEERDLIDSLAEMLRSYFQQLLTHEALKLARDNLELLVRERTAQLQMQIFEYRKAEKRIENYQKQLRQLAAELSLAEARERRDIAGELHEQIGQSLAFMKLGLSQLRGNGEFSGLEPQLTEISCLLDQTIRYTRNLTAEISAPILYELGLEAGLEWITDRFRKKHGLEILMKRGGPIGRSAEDVEVTLFKSVQELLTNVVKHSGADHVVVTADAGERFICVEVADNGRGFNIGILDSSSAENEHFGLFNIKERLSYLGGTAEVFSEPGKGTRIRLWTPRTIRGRTNETPSDAG
jgi:signal transduction histidine kinase